MLNTSVATQMMKIINGYRQEVTVKLAGKYGFDVKEAMAYLENKTEAEMEVSASSSSEDDEPKPEKVKKAKKAKSVSASSDEEGEAGEAKKPKVKKAVLSEEQKTAKLAEKEAEKEALKAQ